MKISSPEIEENGPIPKEFTCDGDNVSPPLVLEDIPEHSEQLILIMDDPDAPGGLFTHWIVGNIPRGIKYIAKNSIPAGAVPGINDFGQTGYGGPCPPTGIHRYRFNLYALDTPVDITPQTDRASVDLLIVDHVLDSAQLVGLYSKTLDQESTE